MCHGLSADFSAITSTTHAGSSRCGQAASGASQSTSARGKARKATGPRASDARPQSKKPRDLTQTRENPAIPAERARGAKLCALSCARPPDPPASPAFFQNFTRETPRLKLPVCAGGSGGCGGARSGREPIPYGVSLLGAPIPLYSKMHA
jgi:hypothetical protein